VWRRRAESGAERGTAGSMGEGRRGEEDVMAVATVIFSKNGDSGCGLELADKRLRAICERGWCAGAGRVCWATWVARSICTHG
jgi:hypothetical protein